MFQLYIDYFKYLCQIHPVLLHSDAKKVFEVISIEEAFGQFEKPGTGGDVFFRLFDLSWKLKNEGGANFYDCQGGFIIIVSFDVKNLGSASQIAARTNAEKYATDFAIHMVADSQNGHPLFDYSIDEMEQMNWNAQPLLNTGTGSYDGLICTFQFKKQFDPELSCHPETGWQELSPYQYGSWATNSDGSWQLNNDGKWQLG